MISVYLVQTGTENRLVDLGAFTSGATIHFSNAAGSSNYVANSASTPPIWVDHLANKRVFTAFNNRLRFDSASDFSQGVKGQSLEIGSFRVTGGAAGNETVLTTSISENVGDINFLADTSVISPTATNLNNRLDFGTLTITAVPEPSTLILVGVAATSMGAVAWRRRKRQMKSAQMNG